MLPKGEDGVFELSALAPNDDEALGGDAVLTAVDEPAFDAGFRGALAAGVREHGVGAGAAER